MSYALHKTTLFGDFHLESEEPVYKVSGGCQSQNADHYDYENVAHGYYGEINVNDNVQVSRGTGERRMTELEHIGRITTDDKKGMQDILSSLKDTEYFFQQYHYEGEGERYCDLFRVVTNEEKIEELDERLKTLEQESEGYFE